MIVADLDGNAETVPAPEVEIFTIKLDSVDAAFVSVPVAAEGGRIGVVEGAALLRCLTVFAPEVAKEVSVRSHAVEGTAINLTRNLLSALSNLRFSDNRCQGVGLTWMP